MPLESLSVRLSGINSASNGIDGGTGCNLFIYFKINYNYIDQSAVCVAYSFHMIHEYPLHIIKIKVSSIGTYRTMGPQDSGRTIRNDHYVRATIMNKESISVVLDQVIPEIIDA